MGNPKNEKKIKKKTKLTSRPLLKAMLHLQLEGWHPKAISTREGLL